MKKFKNKRVLTITAILLVLVASAGLAGAFFSDYEHAIGQATFTLGNNTSIDEKVQGKEKTISIHNNGEGDAFVRMAVYGPDEMTFPEDKIGKGWNKHDDGFWYYEIVLPEGGDTNTIVASIDEVPLTVDLSELDVIVVHEAVPVMYNEKGEPDMNASWAAANNQ